MSFGRGNRAAFIAGRGKKWVVVVDGAAGKDYDGFIRGSRLVRQSPASLEALMLRDLEIFRVEMTITEP